MNVPDIAFNQGKLYSISKAGEVTDCRKPAGEALGHWPFLVTDAVSSKALSFWPSRILGARSSALLHFHDLNKRLGAKKTLKILFLWMMIYSCRQSENWTHSPVGRAKIWQPRLREGCPEAVGKAVSLWMMQATAIPGGIDTSGSVILRQPSPTFFFSRSTSLYTMLENNFKLHQVWYEGCSFSMTYSLAVRSPLKTTNQGENVFLSDTVRLHRKYSIKTGYGV